MNLNTATQVATIASPLIATTIFVATVFYDRWHQRMRHRAERISTARTMVFTVSKHALWPGSLNLLLGWGLTLGGVIAELSLALPKRHQDSLGKWLVDGGSHAMSTKSAERIATLKKLLEATVLLKEGRHKDVRKAVDYANLNPWPTVAGDSVKARGFFTRASLWILQRATGDHTFGVR